jgi:hypothetical protein
MKIFPLLAAASICAVVSAQSPLAVIPVAPVGYFGYNAPSNNTNVYFNLTVNSPVTLQAIETPLLSPAGQLGTLSVYTCPSTHVGNELNAAAWTLAATGAIVGKGTTGSLATLTAASCQEDAVVPNTGFLLAPGSYGIAVRYQGVNPLLVGVGVLQTFSNSELTVSSGALQYAAFTSALQGPATAQGYTAWCFRGNIVYANGSAPHACAESLPYGEGCYKVHGSPHQEFTDSSTPSAAGAAAAALNGRNLTFLNTGTSYVLTQGTNAFIAPTGAANTLALGDDAETQVTLPVPFVYPGGVATDFFVHSNGFISVASNNTLPGGLTWVPDIAVFLNAPATAWWSWHDYNPAEAGSGQVKWEQVGSKLIFTWDGVESYPTTAVNPSTWQMQFDTTTGQVDMVWQTIDAVGGSGFLEGDDHLVGYSPGGISPTGAQINVTTVTGLAIPFPETFPLVLTTTGKPIIGSTISLDTSNPTVPSVGLNFVSTVQIPAPGFDLGIIGAAGCPAFVDVGAGVGNVISNLGLPGLSMSVNFPLPNNPAFAGIEIFSQSVWLDAAQNAAGFITSNGLTLLLGNY